MERVEDFIWGRVNEAEYLKDVVANDALDSEQLLLKVEAIQKNLNMQLRQGVEENYPRLLEQVTAIEELDAKQANFDDEMQKVVKHAQQSAQLFSETYTKLKDDITAIRNLTLLNRLLVDGLRCDELVKNWALAEEYELIRCAEVVNELNALLKSNKKLRHLRWLSDGALSRIDDLRIKTRARVISQLKDALISLSCSEVSTCLKALSLLFSVEEGSFVLDTTQSSPMQKELNDIMMESVRDVDALFNQLCATFVSNTTQNITEKSTTKFLLQLGNRLHSSLEQYQLLGMENAQTFVRHICKIIGARSKSILSAPWLALRLLQTIYKCLATHPDSITRLIRDALAPLKLSILSQSLSTLFTTVDAAFAPQDTDELKSALIVEKLNSVIRAELENVDWDLELRKEMELNVTKTLRYVGTKVEQRLQINSDTLQLSGRVSRQQFANYQMLNVAHNFIKNWPQADLSQSLNTIIEPSVDALLTTMRSTVSLVMASMHSEPLTESMPTTATSSLYMKELCNHLKVFRVHVTQIERLVESVDALPNFLNYVVDQLLLHTSLVRPMCTNSADRFAKDLEYLCRVGLQPFNCKTAKHVNGQVTIADFFRKCAARFSSVKIPNAEEVSEFEKYVHAVVQPSGGNVPAWLAVNLLINISGAELSLPHESVGWQLQAYVEWFNSHTDVEHFKFFRNLLVSYRQAVMARGVTQFVPLYPLINEIVESHLPQHRI